MQSCQEGVKRKKTRRRGYSILEAWSHCSLAERNNGSLKETEEYKVGLTQGEVKEALLEWETKTE